MLGEAVPAVDRAVTSGLKGYLSLLAAVGADHRIHLAGAIATTTTTAASAPARLPAGGTALGLIGEAAAGVVLLILGREREFGPALDAGQGLVCVRHSTTSFGCLLVVECETKQG
jgi:hypothetical protein